MTLAEEIDAEIRQRIAERLAAVKARKERDRRDRAAFKRRRDIAKNKAIEERDVRSNE